MDSVLLKKILERVCVDKAYFEIISSVDIGKVNLKRDRTFFLVVHVALRDLAVGHFILFEFLPYKNVVNYWDSYGQPVYHYIKNIPFEINQKVYRQLQDSASDLCAWYVIFYVFISLYTKGGYRRRIEAFSFDTKQNDQKIRRFAKRITEYIEKKPSRTCTESNSPVFYCMCKCDFMNLYTT